MKRDITKRYVAIYSPAFDGDRFPWGVSCYGEYASRHAVYYSSRRTARIWAIVKTIRMQNRERFAGEWLRPIV